MLREESKFLQAYLTRESFILRALIPSPGTKVLLNHLEITVKIRVLNLHQNHMRCFKMQMPELLPGPEESLFNKIPQVILNCSQLWKHLV